MAKYNNLLIGSFLISFVTLLVYIPVLQNDFVNWDDDTYVYENRNIQSLTGGSLKWMFTSFHAANWHPLTWFSHALDYALWGLNPLGHHLTSILLHAVNTLLVVVVITRLIQIGQGRSSEFNQDPLPATHHPSPGSPLLAGAVTGLLFGIHPLHVESVAWISERKDVLYALFYLLSIFSYLWYCSSQVKRAFSYILCLIMFVLSLMSKPMAVTLPAVLIILDIYPLQRLSTGKCSQSLKWLILEKLPFFFFSIASSVVTILAQERGGALVSLETKPLADRIIMAARSMVFYLYKTTWPKDLAPLYPYPAEISIFERESIISLVVLVAITVFCIYSWRKTKLFTALWMYYIVTLFPVAGIIQAGLQAAADRYSYLPSLGPFVLFGLGAAGILQRAADGKSIFRPGGSAVILCFIALSALLIQGTLGQQRIWKNSIALWSSELNMYPDSTYRAYNNLGRAYQSEGLHDKAMEHYVNALGIRSDFPEAHNNLGTVYKSRGLIRKAIEHFEISIRLNPDYHEAHNNLGFAYYQKGETERAIRHLRHAVQLNPENPKVHLNLGIVYKSQGLIKKAEEHLDMARRLNPSLFQMGDVQK